MTRYPPLKYVLSSVSVSILLSGCTLPPPENGVWPADIIDLSYWKITLPLEANSGKAREVSVSDIKTFYNTDFFYANTEGGVVFATPNKAPTTGGSTNTRSELRQMMNGNSGGGPKDKMNNFALAANPNAKKFAGVGGQLKATLKVDAVSLHAGYPNKPPAYSMVVGQIHAGKDEYLLYGTDDQFGWGNEPIKIYYKKWPNHTTGSVFWTYEKNLPRKDPNRTDVAYPVWGNTWENPTDPAATGIALGEEFSYVINVHNNIMYLTFTTKNQAEVNYQIDLSNNIDAYGKVDALDNPDGYQKDWFYFKAGAYNQCSSKDAPGIWYTNCPGTGEWAIDKANGDYAQATFYNIELSTSEAPSN
ncbi:polysaccharide lyase family 7 protein [Psychromonas sp. 14N.309.X.WAT.B.A12]|uniref:polysaccharide lyase family 7 protein n=1 Tax=unclassified Psychromonas TaxID=2614957 RepID=UPI0025B0104C|nr:polysaccharide lyase family 7 protein [Psychromonas sp. 14N.309.X.WAT.B.A12]MDN2663713.1 polysaccharide lyase family 7 protein [Psychromonas sp. 14N.309.X.WAT.B.A12]